MELKPPQVKQLRLKVEAMQSFLNLLLVRIEQLEIATSDPLRVAVCDALPKIGELYSVVVALEAKANGESLFGP